MEMQAADLRLMDEEGIPLLSCDPFLIRQAIAPVLRTADGLIAGVKLFLLALQRHNDLETALATFDISHQYLTEYFLEHVWYQQSPPIQSFLLHTTILDNLSAPLCAAVTGLPNGHELAMPIGRPVCSRCMHFWRASLSTAC